MKTMYLSLSKCHYPNIYASPCLSGQVPAGLQVELQIQLFPMCAVQAGHEEQKKIISQDVIIHTETDILYLPVTANIL